MSGLVTLTKSDSGTYYDSYTLTADALVFYDLGIDDVDTGSAPEAAYIEISILVPGGSTTDIAVSPIGPVQRSGSVYLPSGTVLVGDWDNEDSIDHYGTAIIQVFYPGNA